MCNCSSSLQLATYSKGKLYPLGHNLISVLFLTSCLLIVIMFQSTWPQLDISPCSYQPYSVIALILLYLALLFYSHRLFLFDISHIFDKAIKSCEKKNITQTCTLVKQMQQHTINTSIRVCNDHHTTGDLMLIAVDQKESALKEPAAYIS